MEQIEGEFGIPCSGLGASNGTDAGEICGSKKNVPILVLPGGGFKKFFDEGEMGYSLITLEIKIVPYHPIGTKYVRLENIVEGSVYTCQRGIMLDPVV